MTGGVKGNCKRVCLAVVCTLGFLGDKGIAVTDLVACVRVFVAALFFL